MRETLSITAEPAHSVKRRSNQADGDSRPRKRVRSLLDEASGSSGDDISPSDAGGVSVENCMQASKRHGFTINRDYARRFEHNKTREELQKCEYGFSFATRCPLNITVEDKYGRSSRIENGTMEQYEDSYSTESSSDEEDDQGILASGILDAEIQDTLEAIRRKDPRVYDKNATFYTGTGADNQLGKDSGKNEDKPIYLHDYHRKNLLDGGRAEMIVPDEEILTYAQEQDELKDAIVKEMHSVNNDKELFEDGQDKDDDVEAFLVRKSSTTDGKISSKQSHQKPSDLDVEGADKDPEAFLTDYMSARAWVPPEDSGFQPFESDDEEEERRADLFEEAYNLRFEDPNISNEKLLSHARDAAAKYSVRKETTNSRKKAREIERSKKSAMKHDREEEKARLRKLHIAMVEEKTRKIKEAAGLRGKLLQEHDWAAFLEEVWDDGRWEEEMQKRFGDEYYADRDSDGIGEGHSGSKHKLKKPKWENDIYIGDLVPDFNEMDNTRPQFELMGEGLEDSGTSLEVGEAIDFEDSIEGAQLTANTMKNQRRDRDEHKQGARRERRKIEQLVDQHIDVEEKLSNFGKKHSGYFRYRETSPTAYGLTAQDILMASDSQLNQYAGLKKMAAFRDAEKKKKDKKRLGKKARLRQWRKETFGSEAGAQRTFTEIFAKQDGAIVKTRLRDANDFQIREGERKKRSRKGKI